MRDVLIGQVDYSILVKIVGTDGAPETGLAHTDIDIAYSRVETDNDVTTSDVAPASLSALTDAHSDWGWKEVSATDHPGLYRLDIADAVFASGAWEAVVTITDASGTDFYAVDIGFRLVSNDPQVALATASALDAVDNFIDTEIGDIQSRLPAALVNSRMDCTIDGTGMETGAVDSILNRDASGSTTNSTLGAIINDWENGGRLDLIVDDILTDTGTTLQAELDGIQADTEDIQSRLPASLTASGLMRSDTLRVGGTLQTAGDLSAQIDAVDNFIDTEISAIITTLGTPAGASISADILVLDNLVDDLESRVGTPSNLGSGATLSANLVDIESQTDDIGVAGAGLTDLGGMSTAMRAQVESEANDALVGQNLDHLVKIAVDTNFATTVHLDSVIGHLADNGTTATFDRTTDSLEALQAEHDATQAFIDTEVAAILAAVDTEVAAIVSAIGTPSNLGSGATLAANLVDIESQTDDIGVAGAGLTDLGGMSTGMKAQVQTEAEDALVVHRLDELLNADSDIDGAAPPTVGSVFHELMSKTAGSFTFDQTTDSLEAIRDRGDAAWITATGFSTLTQADIRTAVGLASANMDTQLAAIDDLLDTEIAAIQTSLSTLFTTARPESYRADGATGSIDQMLYELLAHHGEKAITGTELRLNKINGTTQAMTFLLNSALTPTAATRDS